MQNEAVPSFFADSSEDSFVTVRMLHRHSSHVTLSQHMV